MASEEAEKEEAEKEGRSYWGMAAPACDSCKAAPALLFCRADSAFLCGACDAKVHCANKLASRHGRVWMCEVCEQAPASVTCNADAAALCVSCDADIHSANPLARRHERVPIQPFFDFLPKHPAVDLRCKAEEKGVDDDEVDGNEGDSDDNNDNEERKDWLQQHPNPHAPDGQHISPFSDKDPYLDLDYAASLDAGFHHMDSVVPVQNRPSVRIHHVPGLFYGAPESGAYDFDYDISKAAMYAYAPSLNHSVSSSEVGVVPDSSAVAEISNPYVAGVPVNPASFLGHNAAAAVVGTDREARVMRYREKRKNRKFEKTIRYASRKAYAETRPRVKGRFAKRTEMDGAGYGVVPSF